MKGKRITHSTITSSSVKCPKAVDPKEFEGCLPYDAQYVGLYQPLLGWRSRTTQQWIARQVGKAIKTLMARIKSDQRKVKGTVFEGGFDDPGPRLLYDNDFRWLRTPLLVDGGKSLKKLIAWLEQEKKKITQEHLRQLLVQLAPTETWSNPPEVERKTKELPLLELYHRLTDQRRQQQVGTLTQVLERLDGISPYVLEHAFQTRAEDYQRALSFLSQLLAPASKEVRDEGYRLSPIGLLTIYRHYFYDLGTYLGPSEQHIWVAPYSETELFEVWSQTSYRFRESETSIQLMQAEEETVTETTELSEQFQKKNESDFKTGVTMDFGYNFGVAQGSGSASLDYGTNVSTDKQTARKRSSEITSKAASEMKRSVRLLTRESAEVRIESSRRHLIKNPTPDVVSYEMRRKMQKVGIQMKHLGTQLCYQLIIDEPGNDLGLAELVHIAKPADFSTIPPPDVAPPSYQTISEDFQFPIRFEPLNGACDDCDYHDGRRAFLGEVQAAPAIKTVFEFQAPVPQPGYQLTSIVERSFQRTDLEEDVPSLWATEYEITSPDQGKFRVRLRDVNFEEQPVVQVTASLTWTVKDEVREIAEGEYNKKMSAYEFAKQREAQQAIVRGLRERINLARSIKPRPSADLREEERTILYRRVLSKILHPELNSDELHAQSDIIRTYFDTDKMLYFVAPDWWKPKLVHTAQEAVSEELEEPIMPTIFFQIIKEESGGRLRIDGYVHRGNPDDATIKYTWTLYISFGSGGWYDLGSERTSYVANPHNPNQPEISAEFKWETTTISSATGEARTEEFIRTYQIPNPYYGMDTASGEEDEDVVKQVLDTGNQLGFGREQPPRPNNYMITEDSEPAPLGSSIGWITQLDADAHRNAFLNCAWARVVIPIRRGREEGAIKWLKQPHIEGEDGLGDDLLDDNLDPVIDPATGNPKTIEEALTGQGGLVEQLGQITENDIFLEGQKVYEEGFKPLPDSFEPGPDPFEVFASWMELLPTKQVVPVEYTPSD